VVYKHEGARNPGYNEPPAPYYTNVTTDKDTCAINTFEHLLDAYFGASIMEWDAASVEAIGRALVEVGHLLLAVGLLDAKQLYQLADIELPTPEQWKADQEG
jgi:hypothetical protein